MKKTLLFSFFIGYCLIAKAQWVQTNGPFGGQVNCFASNGPNLFAGAAEGGVYMSTNNGNLWMKMNTGLSPYITVLSFSVRDSNIFLGSLNNGIYLSNNNGNSWIPKSWGLTSYQVSSLAISDTNIFAGTLDGVFLSTNNGDSWSQVNTGVNVTALAISDSNIFAGTSNNGVFLSTNNGISWTSVGLTNNHITCMIAKDTSIFAGTWFNEIYRTNNNGGSWVHLNSGLTQTHITAFAVSGSDIFAGTQNGGIYRSSNNGNSWQALNSGLNNLSIITLYTTGTSIFAGELYPGGMSRSTNNGNSWTTINDGLKQLIITNLVKTGSNLIATTGTYASDVFLSTDNGNNWRVKGLSYYYIESLAASGNNIFVGTRYNGLYLSTDTGSTWMQKGFNNMRVSSLTINKPYVFASSGTYGSGCVDGALYFSADSGNTWISDTTGMGPVATSTILISDSIIFVPACSGLFVSTNYGSNWAQVINPTAPFQIDRLANIGSNVFAGVNYSGSSVYLSTDTGISWTPVWTPHSIYAFAISGTNIFAAVPNPVSQNGVYMSSDTGTTWITVNDSLTDRTVLSLAIDSTYIYAGTRSSVFKRPLAGLIPVSVKENTKNPEVKIYPNPAKSDFTISAGIIMKGAWIEIFNLVGEKIYSVAFKNKQQIIKTKAFPEGIYFVKVFDGEKYCCKKIIIERD